MHNIEYRELVEMTLDVMKYRNQPYYQYSSWIRKKTQKK